MRQIRAHVFHVNEASSLETDVFRDIDQAIAAGLSYLSEDRHVCIHIGIGRPSGDAIRDVICSGPPRVYLTEPARWSLPEQYVKDCVHVAEVSSTVLGRPVPVHRALTGWGYEEEVSPEQIDSSETSSALEQTSSWVSNAIRTIPVLDGTDVKDEDSYWEVRAEIESSVRVAAESIRRAWMLKRHAHSSCSDLARHGPAWLRAVELSSLSLKVRTLNVLVSQDCQLVSDLERWGDMQLLRLRSFGRVSLEDLRSRLFSTLLAGPPEYQEMGVQIRDVRRASTSTLDSLWLQLRHVCTEGERCEPVEALGLGTRSSNVLHQAQIRTIGELLDYDTDSLLAMPNFGITSLREVTGRLLNAIQSLPVEAGDADATPDDFGSKSTCLDTATDVPLVHAVAMTLESLDPDDRKIVRGRLGADGELRTLDELGAEVGLSKERVRQIARNKISHILGAELWDDVLRAKLSEMLGGRQRPLTPDLIMALDPWFAGFEDDTRFLCGIIRAFGEGQFHCWSLEGMGTIVTRLPASKFRVLQDRLRSVVTAHLDSKPTIAEVRDAARGVAIGEQALDLFEPLTELLLEEAIVGDSESEDGQRILSLSSSIRGLCMHVLTEAQSPLHYSEVAARVSTLAQRTVNEQVVHGVLGRDAVLFGRGLYGLRSHLEFDQESIHEVKAVAREAIVSGPPGRQWHCEEICEIIVDAGVLPRSATPYEVSMMLEGTDDLEYLGRLVWMATSHSSENGTARAGIAQIVESAIVKAGRPLSNDEIWTAVESVRGTSEYRLVPETERVIRLKRGLFGLVDRDVGLDDAAVRAWCQLVRKELDQEGELALEDIEALADRVEVGDFFECDPAVLSRLAAKAGIGSLARGGRLVGSEE